MHIIPIHVAGKVALCPKRYLISSNCDYVLRFTFDSAWDDVPAKTARVLIDDRCLDLPFTGTDVALPRIPACASLSVGVFSDSLATTAAELGCIVSVADSDAEVWNALTETQYTTLFSMLNALENRIPTDHDALITAWMDTHFADYCAAAGVAEAPAEGVSF